jgi:hypothetical protein
MRPLGYLYKHVARRPQWLKAPHVEDIYSLSGCISRPFADYIRHWKHNGYWLFDSPAIIKRLADEHSIALDGSRLFYYEGYEQEFDDRTRVWARYEPEGSFETKIEVPVAKTLEGFDVVSYSVHTSPECSPLSCNGCAESTATNSHCLFPTFDDARHAIESGRFNACEPGPYRIIAVYSVGEA